MVHDEVGLNIGSQWVKLQYISISRDYLRKFIHEALLWTVAVNWSAIDLSICLHLREWTNLIWVLTIVVSVLCVSMTEKHNYEIRTLRVQSFCWVLVISLHKFFVLMKLKLKLKSEAGINIINNFNGWEKLW